MEKLEVDLQNRSKNIGEMADSYASHLTIDARAEQLNVLKCLQHAALELHNASIWVQRNNDIEARNIQS